MTSRSYQEIALRQAMSDDNGEEVERLREAFKRDRAAWLLEAARGQAGDATKHLDATIKRLYEVDTEVASALRYGWRRLTAPRSRPEHPVGGSETLRHRVSTFC